MDDYYAQEGVSDVLFVIPKTSVRNDLETESTQKIVFAQTETRTTDLAFAKNRVIEIIEKLVPVRKQTKSFLKV